MVGKEVLGGGGGYHDCHVLVVDAVVVHGWLEEVRVLLEPERVSCALLHVIWHAICVALCTAERSR